MSSSSEYDDARDEDVNPLADVEDSSDDEPLQKIAKKSPKKNGKFKKSPKKDAKKVITKKGNKKPVKAPPKKDKRVVTKLVSTVKESESEVEEYEVSSPVNLEVFAAK